MKILKSALFYQIDLRNEKGEDNAKVHWEIWQSTYLFCSN